MSGPPRRTTDDLLRDALARGLAPVAGMSAQPALRAAVVTCMDCRIDLDALLGLEQGEAHVIRNAGGLVTDDALRSLSLSQALLGTRQTLLVQHTGCGLNGDEADLRRRVAAATGTEPAGPLGAFADVEASVRAGLARLRDAPGLVSGSARGFIYELESGRLREVT